MAMKQQCFFEAAGSKSKLRKGAEKAEALRRFSVKFD